MIEMVQVSQSLSSKMRNMSIVCAFMVVMIHCRPDFQTGTLAWWVKQFTENGLTQIAVPYFFLASGFFIAPKLLDNCLEFDWCGYKREIMKRLHTLVVPYFLWLALFWLFTIGMTNLISWYCGNPHCFYLPNLEKLGIWYKNCPLLTPLWYVRGLFLIVLMSPALVWLIRHFGVCGLLVLLLAYGALCPFAPMPYWTAVQDVTRCRIFPVLGIFYFSLGTAMRMGIVKIPKSRLWSPISIACAAILMFLRAYFQDAYISSYFGMLSIPCALYGVWNFIPDASWPKWIVSNAFAVFLIHKFALWIMRIFVNLGHSLLAYFLMAAVAFLISLIAANLLRVMSPRLSGIMFGGR